MYDPKLHEAARRTVGGCLAAQKGETVVVVTDHQTHDIGEALSDAAAALGAEAVLSIMAPRQVNGEEPPAPVAALMRASQVLLLATKVSLSHTRARKEACDAGARCASMPGVTADMMMRTMAVDYHDVAARSRKLADALKGVKTLRLTTPAGTDMTINVDGCNFGADTGLYLKAGDFGNLPAGEVCTAPAMPKSSGVAVFDGSFANVGILKDPIRITFADGVATAVEGGEEAADLRALLDKFGRGARILAEIGIGTHPTARLTGAVLEDEKISGTVHLAVGNNVGFGGTNNVALHLDGVILNPTLVSDAGTPFIVDGEPRF